ncbi:hypothetical protein LP417_07325 [Polaromonas sp. P1-6]|nr:hypothetical protein LP417_07325 [Polaromonas sp. P1-6]
MPCSPALAALDGRVNGQQVGLGGQVFDGGHDPAYGLALLGQSRHAGGNRLHLQPDAVHPGRHVLGGLAPALGALSRLLRAVRHQRGLLAGYLRCLPNLFYRGGGLAHDRS